MLVEVTKGIYHTLIYAYRGTTPDKVIWLCTALDNGVDCCCTRLLDLSHAQILALLFVCQYGCLASYHVIFQKEAQG